MSAVSPAWAAEDGLQEVRASTVVVGPPGLVGLHTPRRQLLVGSLVHEVDLKITALLMAAAVAVPTVLTAVVHNVLLDEFVARGGNPYERSARPLFLETVTASRSVLALYVSHSVVVASFAVWVSYSWCAILVRTLNGPRDWSQYWRPLVASWVAVQTCVVAAVVSPALLPATSVLVILVTLAGLCVTAARVARNTAFKAMLRFTVAVSLVMGTFVGWNAISMPSMLLGSAADDSTRILWRLVLHPIAVEAVAFTFRWMGREMPLQDHSVEWNDVLRMAGMSLYGCSSLLGRYMLATFESVSAMVGCVLAIAAIELMMRVTVVWRDTLYFSLIMGSYKRAHAYTHSPQNYRVKAAMLTADELGEDAGIAVAAVWTLALRHSDGGGGGGVASVAAVLASAAFQYAIELVTDMLPALFASAGSDSVAALDAVPATAVGCVARARLATKQTVANSHNAWGQRGVYHRRLLAMSLTAWGVYMLSYLMFPCEEWCADPAHPPVRALGLNWWTRVPCP